MYVYYVSLFKAHPCMQMMRTRFEGAPPFKPGIYKE